MSATHKTTISINRGSGANVQHQESISSEAEYYLNELSIANLTTNEEVSFAAARANIKSILIFADGAMTLKTNSSSVPDDTFALTADKFLNWNTNNLAAIPFAADITKFFVTNSSGGTVKLTILALLDVTP